MAEGTDVRSKMRSLIREFEMRSSLASINGESMFSKPSTLNGSNVKKKIEIFNMLSARSSSVKDVKMHPGKSLSSPAVCGRPSSGPCRWDKSNVSSSLPSVFKKAHDFENVSQYRSTRRNGKTDLKTWWGIASANVYGSLNKLTSAPSRFLKRRDKITKTRHEITDSSSENGDSDTWEREAVELLLSNRSRASYNSSNSSYTNLEIDIFDFENEERPDALSDRYKPPCDNNAPNNHDYDSLLLDSSYYGAATKEDTKLETSSQIISPIERKLPTNVDEDTSWTPTRGAKLSQRKSIGRLLSMVSGKLKAIGRMKSPKKEERQSAYTDSGCERSLSRTDSNGSSLSQKSRSFNDFSSVDKEPLALSTPTFTTFGHAEDAGGHRASRKLNEYPAAGLAEVSREEISHRRSETSRTDPDNHTPKRPTSIDKRKVVHFTSNAIRIPRTGENGYRVDFPQKISCEYPPLLPNPPDVSRTTRRRISKQFVAFEERDQTEDEASLTEEEEEGKTSPECESSMSSVLSPPLAMDILNTEIYGRTSSPKSKGFQIEESTNEHEDEKIQKSLFPHQKTSLGNASDKIFRLDPTVSAFANLYQQSEPHRYATVNPRNFNFFMSSKKLPELVKNCDEVKSY